MKISVEEQVLGLPLWSSAAFTQHLLLPDSAKQMVQCGPSFENEETNELFKQYSGKGSVLRRVNRLGKKADSFVHGFQEHVKSGLKITETVKGKLSLGARILKMGGFRKIYKKLFTVREGEKLLRACQCYLYTTSGPMAGLLFISTHNIAFCSDKSIKLSSSPNGDFIRIHYKVIIPHGKVSRVNQSENVENPSQKYIEIVTVDNFDFWFLGFLNHKKTFKCLKEAERSI